MNDCDVEDLVIDISLRARPLANLVSRAQSYPDNVDVKGLREKAQNVVNELSYVAARLKKGEVADIKIEKGYYRRAISKSNDDNDIAVEYINLCEELRSALLVAEQEVLFPEVHKLKTEWLQPQGTGGKFKPKLPMLYKALEEDLINHWRNPTNMGRVRIGLIGYTSVGKSTVTNRLLGVEDPTQNDAAAAVSMEKSTFFPSEFNRTEPLVDTRCGPPRSTLVTIVDIQGLDENRLGNNAGREAGDYRFEIRKADCDIYLLIFDKRISEQQKEWISYIEENLKRRCILVRSKIDEDFLKKFCETHRKCYGEMEREERCSLSESIIKRLRQDNAVMSREVFLVAYNYRMSTTDAKMLQKENSFDAKKFLEEVSHVAAETRSTRVHRLALYISLHMVNTCFRRGYILNALKYKVGAGVAAIIPCGDQFPRYLARDDIRETFGMNNEFHQYLRDQELTIHGYKLQTSVFEKTVKVETTGSSALIVLLSLAGVAGKGLVIAGASVLDDIMRAVPAALTVLSGPGRVIFSASTLGVGAVITVGVCAWSAHSNGKHIFSYINRLCDDMLMVSDAFIGEIIRRQQTPPVDDESIMIIEASSPSIQ